jgi:AcrR family transcriptional regulator
MFRAWLVIEKSPIASVEPAITVRRVCVIWRSLVLTSSAALVIRIRVSVQYEYNSYHVTRDTRMDATVKTEYSSLMTHIRRRSMNPAGKREAVLEAGEKLFAAQGYTRTTIAEIAVSADVAVGSVYRLFPDKPAVLAALHQRMEDRFIDAMTSGWMSCDDYRKKFDPMIDALLDEAESVLETMPLYAMTRDMIGATDFAPGKRMIETIAEFYTRGVTAKAYYPFIAVIAASIAHGMVEGGMRAWMADPTPKAKAIIGEHLKSLFKQAFLTAPVQSEL